MKPIFDALARHATQRPATTAFCEPTRSICWADLAHEVATRATAFRQGPAVVGIALMGIDYVIADLAATLAGRRVVPVPSFFSAAQVAHLLRDAGAVPVDRLPQSDGPAMSLTYAGGAERVIYTSGTTGQPKGVLLGDRQLDASVAGLAMALRPDAGDRYLSVLPQAQLLEQICGIFLPILAGATTMICPEGLAALLQGDGLGLARAAQAFDPSVTVLAPRQLALWVAALRGDLRGGRVQAPASLRHVAVGGAPVAPDLLAEARRLGLPAAEGYGLSEACSVVALTPADAPDGPQAMRVIDGVSVQIDQGEIVVSGPTVMQGYLHQDPVQGPWRTGDLGQFENGCLRVLGRRDAMILRQSGRNIAPEWVEAAALADPVVPFAALVQLAGDRLVLVLAPSAAPDIGGLVRRLADLPLYARPRHLLIVDPRLAGLIRPTGDMNRAFARDLAASQEADWIALPDHPGERRCA